MILLKLSFVISYILLYGKTSALLYPKEGPTREVKSLNGIWEFSFNVNTTHHATDLLLMPVPSSYNDIFTTLEGRDYFGKVTYQRRFHIPESWFDNGRIWMRFGSVCYSAIVYINGKEVTTHDIGHLPFQIDITNYVNKNKNIVKVVVDNTLTGTSVPQGSHQKLPGGRIRQTYTFDFFNYAGIDRPVVIYHTPKIYIKNIDVTTSLNGATGTVKYKAEIDGETENIDAVTVTYKVSILDKDEEVISTGSSSEGALQVPKAKLWWPYLMSETPGYQYTLKVAVLINNSVIDTYDQRFGIRVLTWDSNSFKINGKPIYFRGFGRHEDSDIRGKGLDLPLIIRDHNLIRWVGANSYRTSHYPYAEEIMDLADELGIMILDEVPAVNTNNYNNDLLENHKRSLTELYMRDKNRPSVVMWSIANEPNTQAAASKEYYRHVAAHIKSYENTRPITLAMFYDSNSDLAGEFLDIICFNKYEAWYIYTGQLDVIEPELVRVAEAWRKKHNKPVLVTEWGADTAEGLHLLPTDVWSEEFQTGMMSQYFKAFDQLRKQGWFIGEMIWNFADFKTSSDVRRVGLNKKGIFTRQRQPKNSAHFMRKRFWSLAHELNNATLPSDLDGYVIAINKKVNDEL